MQKTCSKDQYLQICDQLNLNLDWPDEPLSPEERLKVYHSKYLDTNYLELTHYINKIDISKNGNLLLAGFGSGEEIDQLLQRLEPHQKLFVIESDLDCWAAAVSRPEIQKWPVKDRLFVFLNFESFEAFLTTHRDLMLPNQALSFVKTKNLVQETGAQLKTLAQKIENEFLEKKNEYAHFLSHSPTPPCVAAIMPESSRDRLLITLALRSLASKGVNTHLIGEPNQAAQQLTPLWILDQLTHHQVTDLLAVNRGRQDLEALLPENCRFTCLVNNLSPELMEPGRQVVSNHLNAIAPLNPEIQQILEKRGLSEQTRYLLPSQNTGLPWQERDIDFLYFGDAPQFNFLHQLLAHPKLGGLIQTLQEILMKSPAYISQRDLELIFVLCEKKSNCPLPVPEQRQWLLALIYEHVVATQNRRKALLDLVRHQPDIPLKIVGHGWESEKELAPYLWPEAPEPLELFARSQVVLEVDGLADRQPNPVMLAAMAQGACYLSAQNDPQKPSQKLVPGEDYLVFDSLERLEILCLEILSKKLPLKDIAQQGKKKALSFSVN